MGIVVCTWSEIGYQFESFYGCCGRSYMNKIFLVLSDFKAKLSWCLAVHSTRQCYNVHCKKLRHISIQLAVYVKGRLP